MSEIEKGSIRVLPGGQEIWTGRAWVPMTTHGPDEPADRIAQAACLWKEDEDGHWFTACDNGFTFNEGGPKDNRFGYCPYCGRHVIFMRHTPEGPGYNWRILEDG